MNPLLAQLDELKGRWLAAQPLAAPKRDELWKKFRLEWNYNSNHIEGNTLTYADTELLIYAGQTKGDHTIREYDEMKAHDLAVKLIVDMAEKKTTLREADIRELNKIILKEPYWAEALTAQGQTTRVEIIPGEYKRFPNNVTAPTGEPMLFASPAETPVQMTDLVHWMQAELEAPKLYPVVFAARLHHRFLRIHPFADGNGRVARLIANFVLMREGFPPLIVKSRDKANYIAALRNADAGDPARLEDYFAREMKWSLDVALRAARGESIEEPGDAEKEVVVFIKQHEGEKSDGITCSPDAVRKSLDNGLRHLLRRLKEKLMTLAPLFERYAIYKLIDGGEVPDDWGTLVERCVAKKPDGFFVGIQVTFIAYRHPAPAPFDCNALLTIKCERGRILITAVGNTFVARYAVSISSEEAEKFADSVLKSIFTQIKREAGQS